MFCSTRTDPISRPHTRRTQGFVLDHRHSLSRHGAEQPARVRGHRRSFSRTKYYVIDEPRLPADPQNNTNDQRWLMSSEDSPLMSYYRAPCSTTFTEREAGSVPNHQPIWAHDTRRSRCLPNPTAHSPGMPHESDDMVVTYGELQSQIIPNPADHNINNPCEQTHIRMVPPTRMVTTRGSAYVVDDVHNDRSHNKPDLVAAYYIKDRINETIRRTRVRLVGLDTNIFYWFSFDFAYIFLILFYRESEK